MFIIRFVRRWSLLFAVGFGAAMYLLFTNIGGLRPIGSVAEKYLMGAVPYVLFALLYVTFSKIDISEMRPRAWHFILQGIRASLSALFVFLICLTDDPSTKLVLEGVFICVICPTASAAAVITEKLGGSIGSLTTYTLIANVVTMIIIPLFFPMVEKGTDITFLGAASALLRNVAVVLVLPLLLALLSRRLFPRFIEKIKRIKDLGFYLWCINLAIISGETVGNIVNTTASGWTLILLLFLPLVVSVVQFTIGKAVGSIYKESISAGQALGQKNTVVGIWLTLTFLNPVAAVAPGAYILWQNIINGVQLWYKEKYGSLPW